jgi:hypothetical protein
MLNSLIGIIASSGGVTNSYESIATVTVGAGGSTSVSFTSIPSTYSHLQLRILAQFDDTSDGFGGMSLRFNSDSGNNYTRHDLLGDGVAAATGSGTASNTAANIGRFLFTPSSSVFGVAVVDILDYADTNKYKTVRALGGVDKNTSGDVRINSSVWVNTAAISSITIPAPTYYLKQYSQIALYGIKG